jgi:hypothetical protein
MYYIIGGEIILTNIIGLLIISTSLKIMIF